MILSRIFCILLLCLLVTAGRAAESQHARTERAAEGVAEILLAADMAQACPIHARRLGGRSTQKLVADGVVMLINDLDLKMTDFVRARQRYDRTEMQQLKRHILIREGAPTERGRALCFFVQRIVGTDHPIGRFMERR